MFWAKLMTEKRGQTSTSLTVFLPESKTKNKTRSQRSGFFLYTHDMGGFRWNGLNDEQRKRLRTIQQVWRFWKENKISTICGFLWLAVWYGLVSKGGELRLDRGPRRELIPWGSALVVPSTAGFSRFQLLARPVRFEMNRKRFAWFVFCAIYCDTAAIYLMCNDSVCSWWSNY